MKAFTSIEQSKKLAEILPLESADMHYYKNLFGDYIESLYNSTDLKNGCELKGIEYVPAWSLAALLQVLPDEVKDNHFLTLSKEKDEYCCCYEDINGNSFKHTFADNPVNVCYEMILKLNELKML